MISNYCRMLRPYVLLLMVHRIRQNVGIYDRTIKYCWKRMKMSTRDKGLKGEKVIGFFDNYVHDSLAGFAKDATLPSDPRVVYLGDDEKYQYASSETRNSLFSDDDLRMA